VTGEHALFIDGVLIPVRNLINGTTITRREAREHHELEYFHIKVKVMTSFMRKGLRSRLCEMWTSPQSISPNISGSTVSQKPKNLAALHGFRLAAVAAN
jgi:hypothetical protein